MAIFEHKADPVTEDVPKDTGLEQNLQKCERRIGSLKGLKFLADGVELDDFDDEIAEMFEESEIFDE